MADPKTTIVEVQLNTSGDDDPTEIVSIREDFDGTPSADDLGKSIKRLKALAKKAARTNAEGF